MKQTIKKLIFAATLLLCVAVPLAPVSAASGSISLTANRSTVAAGGTIIIAVYVNGGGNNVNAVQADLSYPASKLQYVGFSASGSSFEIGAASGGGDGSATLARGSTSPLNGSGLLGTVTFKALAGSGSAAISVAGSSSLVSDGNAVPFGSSGVSVNFGASAAASSGSAKSSAVAAAPAPPKDTSAPVISAVKVTEITPFTAVVTWTTNELSDSVIDYGLDDKYGLSISSTASSTAHSLKLESSFLNPLTLLHYRVKSVDGAGNSGTSPDQTLQLPGIPITVIVRGSDGKPQAGAQVTLDNSTGITDTRGMVVLRSGLGNKKVTTSYQGVTVQQPLTVHKTEKPLPPIQLDLAKRPLNQWMLSTVGLFVIVLVLIAIDAALFGSRILARATGLKFAVPKLKHAHSASVVGEPPVDARNTIAELMGSPTAVAPAPMSKPMVTHTPVTPIPQPAPEPVVAADDPVAERDPAPLFTEPVSEVVPNTPVIPVAPVQIAIKHHTEPETSSSNDIAHRLKPKPSAPVMVEKKKPSTKKVAKNKT